MDPDVSEALQGCVEPTHFDISPAEDGFYASDKVSVDPEEYGGKTKYDEAVEPERYGGETGRDEVANPEEGGVWTTHKEVVQPEGESEQMSRDRTSSGKREHGVCVADIFQWRSLEGFRRWCAWFISSSEAVLETLIAASKTPDRRGGRLLSCARPRGCSIHLQVRQTTNNSSFRPMVIDEATHVEERQPTTS